MNGGNNMIKNKEKHLSNLIVDEIGNRILLMIIFGCIGSFAMYWFGSFICVLIEWFYDGFTPLGWDYLIAIPWLFVIFFGIALLVTKKY